MSRYALALFAEGTRIAKERGLVLHGHQGRIRSP